MSTVDELGRAHWQGQRGRLEVWYATFTDAATGLGGWVHIETVAPTDGSHAHTHGWMAVFPAVGEPVVERFGPLPAADPANAWVELVDLSDEGPSTSIGPGGDDGRVRLVGRAGRLAWDLEISDGGEPLYTFSRAVWERHLLPAAQIVPTPTGTVRGSVTLDGVAMPIQGHGALARIYGHGNAQRWGWLHADLGEGGILEIVTAVARRRSMRWLPPLALVQLRIPGEPDWPRNPLLAAPRFRTSFDEDGLGFHVRGRGGGRRLTVDVTLPADGCVSLGYVDPDGATATCTNSERASATVEVDGASGERRWVLDGTAHAEVGTRP